MSHYQKVMFIFWKKFELHVIISIRIFAYSITEIKTGIVTNGYKSLGFFMLHHKYVVYLENMIK